MATVVLGAVGSYFGGPVGYAVGAAIGSYVDQNYIFPEMFESDEPEPPKVGSMRMQSADEGARLNRCYGAECRVEGIIIWAGPISEVAETVGGKGGGNEQTIYTYFRDCAVAFCEGPPSGLGVDALVTLYVNAAKVIDTHDPGLNTSLIASTDASGVAGTIGHYDPDTDTITDDFYSLTITIPGSSPTIQHLIGTDGVPVVQAYWPSGISINSTLWDESANNGDFRLQSSLIEQVSLYDLTVVLRSRTNVFADDANLGGNAIRLFGTLPARDRNVIAGIPTAVLGDELTVPDPFLQSFEGIEVPPFRGLAHWILQDVNITVTGNQLPNFNAVVDGTGTTETVGGALQKMLDFAKRDNSHIKTLSNLTFDTTAVDAIALRGYTVRGPLPISAAMQPLLLAYDLIVQEEGGTLTFLERKNAPEIAIDPDDFAAHPFGTDAPRPYNVEVSQGQALPKEVVVKYIDPEKRYQTGSQRARRLNTLTNNHLSFDIPVVMTAIEAKNIAERILWSAWMNRSRVTGFLPPSYFEIQENDVLTWTDPNTSKAWRVRVQRIERGANHLIRFEGLEEVVALLTHDSAAEENAARNNLWGGDDIYQAAETDIHIVDVAPLRDTDVRLPGVYVGVGLSQAVGAWYNCGFYESLISPTTNFGLRDVISTEAIHGVTTELLQPPVNSNLVDYANTLKVALTRGELESKTADEVLAGANRIIVGSEIIGFETATLVSARNYELTGLLRGLGGTEHFMPAARHVIGERVMVLDPDRLSFVFQPLSKVGVPLYYKAVPTGGVFDDYESICRTYQGGSMKPFSVSCFEGEQSGSDWELTWVRRTRTNYDTLLSDDVPITENFDGSETYEIDILNVGTGALVNTYTSTSPAFTYTAAQQTTDFGGTQSSIRAIVYQTSDQVGRGYPSTDSTFP